MREPMREPMHEQLGESPLLTRLGAVFASVSALLLLLMALVSPGATAAEGDLLAVPPLHSRVTDTTSTLTAATRSHLEEQLKAFEAQKGAQIAVLMVDSTQAESIFDYSTRVFTAWKLGRKGVDDGVLLVVAKADRKIQILTGPGISGALTDAQSKRIIAEVIAPRFQAGDYARGIGTGIEKIMAVIEGEALPPPNKKAQWKGKEIENIFVLLLAAVFFVGWVLRTILGRLLGATATAGLAGGLAWFLVGGLVLPIFAGIVVFVLSLFAGMIPASAFRGRGGGGFGGGGFGGGGFGGGGFGGGGGGFSGGGGGFDGGGASGSW